MSKKAFFGILGFFVIGVIIGYNIHQFFSVKLYDPFLQGIITVTVTGSTFIAVVTLLVQIIPVIVNWWKQESEKKEQDRLRQDEFILDDLSNWESKTIFADIKYDFIEVVPHVDPKDLPYFDEDKRVLKNYGALALWEKGKAVSDSLREDGIRALEKFHRLIDKGLGKTGLRKVLKMAVKSQESYYSLPQIRKLIIEEISGLHTDITPDDKGFLYRGETRFAHAPPNGRKHLTKIIEDLKQDMDVKKEIETFQKAKEQLRLRTPFLEFISKIKEIKNDFNWHGKLKR